MKGRSSNRILVWALAISLAIHAVFAIVARTMPPAQAEPDKPQRISIIHIATPPPTPPPTPVPSTHTSSRRHASTHARTSVHPPRVVAHGGGSVSAGPLVVATAGQSIPGNDGTGSATPSPAPACSNPYVQAHVIDPISPDVPEDAAGIAATAQVQVTLDDRGQVTDAHIYTSTGTMSLDRAAVLAARRSTYAPQVVDCQPAGGSYLFKVDFTS